MSDLLFIDRDEVLGRIENAISALTGGLDIETQRLFVNAVNQVEPLSVSEELVAALRGRAAQSVERRIVTDRSPVCAYARRVSSFD